MWASCGKAFGMSRKRKRCEPVGQGDTDRGSCKGDRAGLDQELPDHAKSAGSDGAADGQFVMTCLRQRARRRTEQFAQPIRRRITTEAKSSARVGPVRCKYGSMIG